MHQNEPHSSLRTNYMSFQKEIRSAKNQWFFTLRDVIFWVILRPWLKKGTFFSFKHHISVSNCRMKLIFFLVNSEIPYFAKIKFWKKWGAKVGAGVWIWNDWVATLKNMNFTSWGSDRKKKIFYFMPFLWHSSTSTHHVVML